MALAVPLSRFTSQVAGGSAFYVRPLRAMNMVTLAFSLERSIHFIERTASDPNGYWWYVAFVVLAIVLVLFRKSGKRG